MARAIGAAEVAPFYLEAEKSDVPGGWPEGGQTRLELPNNHLQYAITWFLLAACLLVIYGVYVRSLYRPSRPLDKPLVLLRAGAGAARVAARKPPFPARRGLS